jgi:hypothetical protein
MIGTILLLAERMLYRSIQRGLRSLEPVFLPLGFHTAIKEQTDSMTSNSRNWILPTLADIFFIAVFSAVLLVGTQMLNLDGDLPRHLLMGKYILQTFAVPSTELFIHPYLNQPYVPHEWLTDVLFYMVYSRWSFAGLVVLSALLLAVTFTLLYSRLSTRLDLRLPVLLLIAWGAAATSLNWAVRPHLVSMCILAFWLFWADDVRQGKQTRLWIFPVVMLIWSNLHGEFIVGILVLLAYAVGWAGEYFFDRSRADLTTGKKLWLALVSTTIASLLNPSGAGPWLSVSGFVSNPYLMSRMAEVNPPDFQAPEMRILLALLVVSIVLLSIKRERLALGQGLLLAGFSAMTLLAFRNIHLYGVVAPFVLSETLGGAKHLPIFNKLESSLSKIDNGVRGSVWSVVFALATTWIVILTPQMQALFQLQEPAFPVRAVAWLKNHPQQGNAFNDLNWGGYLELHLWPNHLSFIDSMSDSSGIITRDYETVITLQEGWQDVLQDHNIEWAILPLRGPLAEELSILGWESVYQDQTAIIVVKR